MSDNMDCPHGLEFKWCADCLKLLSAEEEETESDMGIVDNFMNWKNGG